MTQSMTVFVVCSLWTDCCSNYIRTRHSDFRPKTKKTENVKVQLRPKTKMAENVKMCRFRRRKRKRKRISVGLYSRANVMSTGAPPWQPLYSNKAEITLPVASTRTNITDNLQDIRKINLIINRLFEIIHDFPHFSTLKMHLSSFRCSFVCGNNCAHMHKPCLYDQKSAFCQKNITVAWPKYSVYINVADYK